MDAQLKKGVLELCLLHSAAGEPRYGYDMIRQMRAHFPEVEESAFYAVLRRLRAEGLLEQFPGETSAGPPRKYYRLTEAGRERLAARTADWKTLTGIMCELGIG